MATGTVTVRGSALVSAQPDEAELVIEIMAVEKSHEKALANVSRRSETLQKTFTELDIPESARTTSGISLGEEVDWKDGRRHHKGYRATNRVAVRLDDVDLVARLMNQAITQSDATVQGPNWQIAVTNPARVDAFRKAAEDARRRAEAYASALGARLGDVLNVIEPGLVVRTQQEHSLVMPAPVKAGAAPSRLRGGGPPDIQIEPGAQDLGASVEVTFALEQ